MLARAHIVLVGADALEWSAGGRGFSSEAVLQILGAVIEKVVEGQGGPPGRTRTQSRRTVEPQNPANLRMWTQ
jgi:hypothetical protein